MDLIVATTGQVKTIYSEHLDLHALGRLVITRASQVEPTTSGHWMADLRPVGGPILGSFAHRSQALEAEIAWLNAHWLTSTD